MKQYLTINDLHNVSQVISEAKALKKNQFIHKDLGIHKTLIMLFFNASLRTRLSTEKAASNLGMDVIILNVSDSWNLEFENNVIMNFSSSEHIKEAAQTISQYGDILAVRAFPTLKDRNEDYKDIIINSFKKYANIPIINLESATAHPLQALADAITISELSTVKKPKVVLSWAPHPKSLPQSVPNSFVKMMQQLDVQLSIVQPKGYELATKITGDTPIYYSQKEAFENADFIYAKNWSSYNDYGKVLHEKTTWKITQDKIKEAKFMHCLPVRRNVVVDDDVLDSKNSIVIQQANNRTFAAQVVLKKILENITS